MDELDRPLATFSREWTPRGLLLLIDELTDPDPCEFDHHGYCQAHFWLQDGRCPDGRAQELLALLAEYEAQKS